MGYESQVFISRSYDATTHFETTCKDVLGKHIKSLVDYHSSLYNLPSFSDIFKRGTTEEFDFTKITHLSLEETE
jgi:Rab GDP dissociation inhibitor